MNCRQVQALLSAYIDGEMPGGDMLHVRCHVVHCPACSREEEELRSLKRVLMGCTCIEPPEELEDRLLNRIHGPQDRSDGLSSWYVPVAVGLTAMALTLAILTAIPSTDQPSNKIATDIRRDQTAFSSADWSDGGHVVFAAGYEGR